MAQFNIEAWQGLIDGSNCPFCLGQEKARVIATLKSGPVALPFGVSVHRSHCHSERAKRGRICRLAPHDCARGLSVAEARWHGPSACQGATHAVIPNTRSVEESADLRHKATSFFNLPCTAIGKKPAAI